jgi:hypothetical protein
MARHNVFLIFWFSLFSFSYGQNNPDVTCTQERVVAAYSSDVLVTIMERLISGICRSIASTHTEKIQTNLMIASPNFPPPPGNTNFVSFAQDFLAFQITRTGASDTIPDCQTAFQAIVDKCVKGANFWGGSTTSSGDDFNITNQNYPSDPLLPDPKLWTVVTSNLMTATVWPLCFNLSSPC